MESNQDPTRVADSERGELIERMLLDVIQGQRITKVGDAVISLQKLDGSLKTEEIHDAIKSLERRGDVNLSEGSVKSSFLRNLADVEVNTPFWLAILSTAAIVITTFIFSQDAAWALAKRIAGAIFLFVIPGYVTINAFFARNRLSYIERMALSVGLSLALTSLIGMVLAYGLSGIKLEPIIASMAAFVSVMALLGAYSDFRRRHRSMIIHGSFLTDRSKR